MGKDFCSAVATLSKHSLGHTACLWQDSKLLVYGGENEHREYLSDLVIYDITTSHWTQPDIRGSIPKGRARHAAAVHDDKLYISGGLSGPDNYTSDEICFLDLKTWTWSRSWSFVPRYDHSAWVWGGRFWVFGGLGPDMERTGDAWYLDIKHNPAFRSAPWSSRSESPEARRSVPNPRSNTHQINSATGSSGYAANSSSIQRGSSFGPKSTAPGPIRNLKFVSGPDDPVPSAGTHFHAYSSNCLLDFTTPANMLRASDCNLSALNLSSLQWQKLAYGSEIFDTTYRWHYCVLNPDSTKAWLLGCPADLSDTGPANEEYLSDVLSLDLNRFGLLGNNAAVSSSPHMAPHLDEELESPPLSHQGAKLAALFDKKDAGAWDFVVTAAKDMDDDGMSSSTAMESSFSARRHDETTTSPPIHVHGLILQAMWPHFGRLWNSEMAEFHSKKLHIPEPYSVVRAFLYYLYSDSIAFHPEYCKDLDDVAGMLVMSQMYDMRQLRLLCLNRLNRELDVEHAAVIWERAGLAQDDWLQRRAAVYCMTHWGRIVRTQGFRQLSHDGMVALCEVIDMEGRVVGGEELEVIGGLGGGKFGAGLANEPRSRATSQVVTVDDDNDGQDDEGMELS